MALLWSEFAEPISRRYSAIHEEIAAGDKRALRTHEKCADSSYFVGSASSSRRTRFHHVSVACTTRPFQFIIRERGDDDARADRIDPRAALAPTDGFRHHTQRVRAF